MNERTKTGLEILQAAILLGVTGDVLLRTTPWGLNVLLFVVMLAAAMLMLILKRRAEFWNAPTIALNAALVFFAAMFVWRDSTELKIFDTLAILTILAILTLPVLRIKLPAAGISHYLAGFFRAGISAAFMPFLLAFDDIKWSAIPQNGWSKHLVSVLRGLAIALPILLIFGALFVAADAIFEGLVNKTFNIDGSVLVGHIIFTGIFAWITAGYLRGSLLDYTADEILENPAETEAIKPQNLSITAIKDEDAPPISTAAKETKKRDWQNFDNSVLPRFFTLGAIEISIVLGLINLLFLSFVIVQIPYLFGGFEFVRKSPDFNLAEYARRGFGELVTVCRARFADSARFALAFTQRQPAKRKNLPRAGGNEHRFAVRHNDLGGAAAADIDGKSRLRTDDDSALSDDLYDLARAHFYTFQFHRFARRASAVRLGRVMGDIFRACRDALFKSRRLYRSSQH